MAKALYPPSAISPARSAFAITPSDAVELAAATKGIYVGGAGNLAVTMRDGQVVTFVGLIVGQTLDIDVVKVMATNTTCTNIVGLG